MKKIAENGNVAKIGKDFNPQLRFLAPSVDRWVVRYQTGRVLPVVAVLVSLVATQGRCHNRYDLSNTVTISNMALLCSLMTTFRSSIFEILFELNFSFNISSDI